MSWRGVTGGIEAASKSRCYNDPNQYAYFDYYHVTRGQPLAIGGTFLLKMFIHLTAISELNSEQQNIF